MISFKDSAYYYQPPNSIRSYRANKSVEYNVSQRGIDQSPPLPNEVHFISSGSAETTASPSTGGHFLDELYTHNSFAFQRGFILPIRIVDLGFSCASIISDLSNRTLDNKSAKRFLDNNNQALSNNRNDSNNRIMIEIAPGIEVALRGAEETQDAIDFGFYVTTPCCTCQADISCILDCDYFVCPDCRSISPNPLVPSSIHPINEANSLGLGFHMNSGA
jgi:hypothetical protein